MGFFNEEEGFFEDSPCNCEMCIQISQNNNRIFGDTFEDNIDFLEEDFTGIKEVEYVHVEESPDDILQEYFEELAYGDFETEEELLEILKEFYNSVAFLTAKSLLVADVEEKMNLLQQIDRINL